MTDSLSAEMLFKHVQALADGIGPRPAGTPREARAHEYVRAALAETGITQVETLPFQSPDTWGYAMILPGALALAGNLLPGRLGRLAGGLLSLYAARSLVDTTTGRLTLLADLSPMGPSATQIVRLPAAEEPRRRLVLVGHVDANKHRLTFGPSAKHFLTTAGSMGVMVTVLNGVIQLLRAIGPKNLMKLDYRLSLLGMGAGVALLLADEQGPWIDGANDNASAVACLLGLAAHLRAHPLRHTEVWLAFTGAEETGCLGMHALLDTYGDTLKDAYFLDFEMVGAGELAYVTRHSGLSGFNSYMPDSESVALVVETARRLPEYGVKGVPMTIVEEVGALRSRGHRGICLVGVGEDGFLVNWHQSSDTSANILPDRLEKAARFALACAQTLDEQA